MRRRNDEFLTLPLFVEGEKLISEEAQFELVVEGVDEQFQHDGRRPLQCFTIKMPLPLYLEFKRNVQHLQSIVDPAEKTRYTMTAFVNGTVKKVILPGLKKLQRELLLKSAS
jgi:hypothetical protein